MSNLAPIINNKPYFQTIIPIEKFGESELAKAKELFVEYKTRGIIVNSEFKDNRWQFCDEYENLGIKFVEPGFMYTRRYEGIFGVSGEEMLVWIKVFAVFRLGQNILGSIREFVHDANDLFSIAPEEIRNKEFRQTNILMEFVEILPVIDEEAADYIMDRLELCAEKKNQLSASNPRQLTSFLSYFLFGELLNAFWNSCIDTAEQLFFYPVFLWWRITAILPLRPREFILTPRNCIREFEGKYYLTIRRDNLKGSGRKVHYNIKEDYKLEEYEIPKSLYVLIKGYIDLTNEYEDNVTNTLFRAEPHYKRFHHAKPYTSRFYTYVNLVCALRIFYSDILCGRMGYNVVPFKSKLEKDEIEMIHLGDTRHISMINIILHGGTPTTAMLLAGHADIAMSSHYYANLPNLIECRIYSMFKNSSENQRRMVSGKNFNSLMITDLDYVPIEDGAKCYSKAFFKGDISDCLKATGDNGEIGYCYRCNFYRKSDGKYFFGTEDYYRSEVEAKSALLKTTIKQYRTGTADLEALQKILLELQKSTATYEKYYLQSLMETS